MIITGGFKMKNYEKPVLYLEDLFADEAVSAGGEVSINTSGKEWALTSEND